MAIYSVIVNTSRGKLKTTFTNKKAADEFARLAEHDFGFENVQGDDVGLVSYSAASAALKELYQFGEPLSS